MIIITKTNKDEVLRNIKKEICEYDNNPTIFKNSLDLKDEFIGQVVGDTFWIQKTRPRLFRGPNRAFYGKVIEIDSGTQIVGNFKFIRTYRKQINVIHIIVSILLAISFYNNKYHFLEALITILCINLFFELLLYTNILFYQKEEKAVRKVLNNM